jgi:hypothetical protein
VLSKTIRTFKTLRKINIFDLSLHGVCLWLLNKVWGGEAISAGHFNDTFCPVNFLQMPGIFTGLNSRHFLIPWTGGAFAPLGPFLCPTTEEKKLPIAPKPGP